MAVKKTKTKSFEDSMKRLEEIVTALEGGSLPLESETLDGQYKLTDFPEVKA